MGRCPDRSLKSTRLLVGCAAIAEQFNKGSNETSCDQARRYRPQSTCQPIRAEPTRDVTDAATGRQERCPGRRVNDPRASEMRDAHRPMCMHADAARVDVPPTPGS